MFYLLFDSIYYWNSISLFVWYFMRTCHMDLSFDCGLTCFLFEIVVTLQQHNAQFVNITYRWRDSFLQYSFFFSPWKLPLFSSKNCHFAHFRLLLVSCLLLCVCVVLCEILFCFSIDAFIYLHYFFSTSFVFHFHHTAVICIDCIEQKRLLLHSVQLL